MKWFYFDANALAKRYSREDGTDLVNEIFQRISRAQMTCLTLNVLEIVSILVRKKNDGRLSRTAFDQAMLNLRNEIIEADEFVKAVVNDSLIMSALDLIAKHNINSTDAVILRSVLNMKDSLGVGREIVLLTSDKRLVKAARSEEVIVFDPEVETSDRLQKLLAEP